MLHVVLVCLSVERVRRSRVVSFEDEFLTFLDVGEEDFFLLGELLDPFLLLLLLDFRKLFLLDSLFLLLLAGVLDLALSAFELVGQCFDLLSALFFISSTKSRLLLFVFISQFLDGFLRTLNGLLSSSSLLVNTIHFLLLVENFLLNF